VVVVVIDLALGAPSPKGALQSYLDLELYLLDSTGPLPHAYETVNEEA